MMPEKTLLTRKRQAEYIAWIGTKQRTQNPNHKSYKNYGERGIKVCGRWLGKNGFKNFFNDLGAKPDPSYSLDRINNDGDYEPSNCRWADRETQNTNRRPFKPRSSNSTGHTGVWKNTRNPGTWIAVICVRYKNIHLGVFHSIHEAIEARKHAEQIYRGTAS